MQLFKIIFYKPTVFRRVFIQGMTKLKIETQNAEADYYMGKLMYDDAFFHMGFSYWKNSANDLATWALQKAIDLNPEDETSKDIMKRLMR